MVVDLDLSSDAMMETDEVSGRKNESELDMSELGFHAQV